MSEKSRNYYHTMYRKLAKKLKMNYDTMTAIYKSQFFGTICYGIMLTLFSAMKSDVFMGDLNDFFTGIRNIVQAIIVEFTNIGRWSASFSDGIIQPIIHKIAYAFLFFLPAVMMIIPFMLLVNFGKKFIKWYRTEIADTLSLWVVYVTLAVSIFFGENIKVFITVNLILLNLMINLMYCGIRHYVRKCRKNGEY